MKKKMWVRLFLEIAVIFVAFVAILTVANSTCLLKYYVLREKAEMRKITQKIDDVDLYSDTETAAQKLSEILGDGNYSLKISDSFGNLLFSSFDAPVADYKGALERKKSDSDKESSEMGEGFSEILKGNRKVLRYTATLSGGETLYLSLPVSLLQSSAKTANQFIVSVAFGCLLLTILWVLLLSKRIAKPIREMTETTELMANLDFSRKLTPTSKDEIGRLGEAINRLSENLDMTLKDLNQKNAQLRGEIEAERRLDKMRKGFVANVSHELKTPIAIISGYAEGLKLNINSDEDRREYADVIIDESARMNEMVLGLLELSRLESGSIRLDPTVYDLGAQIREFTERMHKSFEEADATVEIDTPESLPVFADGARMGEVLQNFLSNAASHVRRGGTIKVSAKRETDTVTLSVYNDGEQIPRENMEHIWESFWRGEVSHKREKDRFGLGLSIVHAIAEASGSCCGVKNCKDGVCFWFTVRSADDIVGKTAPDDTNSAQ